MKCVLCKRLLELKQVGTDQYVYECKNPNCFMVCVELSCSQSEALDKFREERDTIKREVARLREALENKNDRIQKIVNWAEAYPLDVFPELTKDDWKRVRQVLEDNGMHLGALSASCMRKVVKGVEEYAREALKD